MISDSAATRWRRHAAAAGLLGSVWLLGCASGAERRPNFVVVLVDTLRGDHLGFAGGAALTPHVDALRERFGDAEFRFRVVVEDDALGVLEIGHVSPSPRRLRAP